MQEVVVPKYRYYTANLLTGEVVMEVPFEGVSWERKISTAGSFQGSIAVPGNTYDYTPRETSVEDHFDLYNSTVPGKYALYVMRDGVCVWGGIIWSREYNVKDRVLSVTALEMVSYLHHRVYWKSFSTDVYQSSNNYTDSDTIKSMLETLVKCVNYDIDEIEVGSSITSNDPYAYIASDVHTRLNSYSVTDGVATFNCLEAHGLVTGDTVFIYGTGTSLDTGNVSGAVVTVTGDTTFTVSTTLSNTGGSVIIDPVTSPQVYISATYVIKKSTYDLLQTSSNINILTDIDTDLDDYYTSALGDANPFEFRGSKMLYVGEIIDNFAVNGVPVKSATAYQDTDRTLRTRFDYFIQSDYDPTTRKFTNTFKAWLVRKDINDPTLLTDYGIPSLDTLYGPSKLGAGNIIFEHPGNIVDLTVKEDGDSAATRFWMVDSENDLGPTAAPYYGSSTNLEYLSAGFPILEVASTDQNLYVTSDDQVAPYAKQRAYRLAPPIGEYTVTVNGSISPRIGEYLPGDWCVVIPNDPFISNRLKPPYENRTGLLVRKIRSMRVSVPDNPSFPETVDLELIPEWEVAQVNG